MYITAEALEAAGYDPNGPAPFYRTWSGPRGRVVVQLYRWKRAPARPGRLARGTSGDHGAGDEG